ncbi:uncharacterized protein [Chelonus insularis]|uniref:uncharacterized protein n=1 Tax=Chelonus insularis TaxID=460826 RepID=UPI00158F1326|nr:uncharacterized protein LOC118073249 [Chelonus insularis]
MAKVKAKGVEKSKKISNNGKKLKPMKIAALIFSAIQELSEAKGSTPNKITGYISYTSDLPENRVKRQVQTTLKRGVEYGILRRYRGHYFLPTGDELDRANRIAVRFARLPTPAPSTLKSNLSEKSKKAIESSGNNRLRSRKTSHPMKQRRSRSLPASPASSLSDTSWSRRDSFSQKSDVD